MLDTNMRSELFVALQFEVHPQLVNGFTVERPLGHELPRAFGAGPALEILPFDPFQSATLCLHGTPRDLSGLCFSKRGEESVFDGTAPAKAARFIAPREVLRDSLILEHASKLK
jgi:hypothetical protein